MKSFKPAKFFQEVKTELSFVQWPNRQQTIKLTMIVLGGSLLVGAYVGGLDALFTLLLTNLVK